MRIAYSTIVLLSFLAVLVSDVITRTNSFIGVSNGSTFLVLGLNVLAVVGLLIVSRFRWCEKMPRTALIIFRLMLLWSLISLVRGGFNAQSYWDWKALVLVYLFSIMVPLAMVFGLNLTVSVRMLRFVLARIFLFGFIFIPVSLVYDTEMYARVVIAVSLFILLVPYLEWRWRILVLVVAAASVSMDFSYRINVIRILLPISFLTIYMFRGVIRRPILNAVVVLAFCTPLLFMFLGITDRFNVFRDSLVSDASVAVVEGGEVRESNLAADTRTFLYREVLSSMRKRDSSFLIGEGGGAGYETEWFADTVLATSGRTGSEVGFLNLLLCSGVVGVLLYAAMLLSAAYYAINRSNNTLCKMLGMFLVMHWVLFFIEDIAKFDLNYFFIWFAIGLCLSHQFRTLTDLEVRVFFEGVLKKRTFCNSPLTKIFFKVSENWYWLFYVACCSDCLP